MSLNAIPAKLSDFGTIIAVSTV